MSFATAFFGPTRAPALASGETEVQRAHPPRRAGPVRGVAGSALQPTRGAAGAAGVTWRLPPRVYVPPEAARARHRALLRQRPRRAMAVRLAPAVDATRSAGTGPRASGASAGSEQDRWRFARRRG